MAKQLKDISEIPCTPEGVLARLKGKICLIVGLDTARLKMLVDRFVTLHYGLSGTSKALFTKTNISNELTKDTMTIKVFFKFLRVLNIKHVKFTVTVTTIRDEKIEVSEDFNLFASGGESDE